MDNVDRAERLLERHGRYYRYRVGTRSGRPHRLKWHAMIEARLRATRSGHHWTVVRYER